MAAYIIFDVEVTDPTAAEENPLKEREGKTS